MNKNVIFILFLFLFLSSTSCYITKTLNNKLSERTSSSYSISKIILHNYSSKEIPYQNHISFSISGENINFWELDSNIQKIEEIQDSLGTTYPLKEQLQIKIIKSPTKISTMWKNTGKIFPSNQYEYVIFIGYQNYCSINFDDEYYCSVNDVIKGEKDEAGNRIKYSNGRCCDCSLEALKGNAPDTNKRGGTCSNMYYGT